MTTGEQQRIFTKAIARLILWAYENGYEMSYGEAYRPQWVADEYAKRGIGVKSSFHINRLAIDLNLFKNGVYLTNTADYLPVGIAWEAMGGTWGGRFTKPDGNHFSWGEGANKSEVKP